MNPQDDDTNTRAGLWVVFSTVAVLLVSVIIWVLKGAGIDTDSAPAANTTLTAAGQQDDAGRDAAAAAAAASIAQAQAQAQADEAAAQANTRAQAAAQAADVAAAQQADATQAAADSAAPQGGAITADEETLFVTFDNLDRGELAAVVHFASASAQLPSDAGAEIAGVIDALQASPSRRVLLAGFHDPTGNASFNADLARKRAFAVRDALVARGVPAERIILRKPEQTTGSGTNAEARRVELRLLD